MYDSNYPSTKKRSNIDDTTFPTAQKSPYREPQTHLHRTPNRSQPSSVPPIHDRLSQTKRSIDEIIQQVSAKKSLNHEAIQEVRNVNQEIVTYLNYNPVRSAQKHRTAEHQRADSSEIVVTSQFEYHQASEEDLKRSQQSAISQQNLDLRSRLNQEIRRNNELMIYAKSLQNENATLRSSRQVRGGSTIDQEYSTLVEQNRYLRSQLSQSHQGVASADILEQLRRLKEENNQLRKETINLLHKQY